MISSPCAVRKIRACRRDILSSSASRPVLVRTSSSPTGIRVPAAAPWVKTRTVSVGIAVAANSAPTDIASQLLALGRLAAAEAGVELRSSMRCVRTCGSAWPVAEACRDLGGGSLERRAEVLDELLDRDPRAVDGEVDGGHDGAGLAVDGAGDRAEAERELFVVDGEARVADAFELGVERGAGGERVGAALGELDAVEQRVALAVGKPGEQHLAHRGAVGGQARADVEVEVDPALALLGAAAAFDVDDVGVVEDGHVDGVAGLVAELLQVGGGDLA